MSAIGNLFGGGPSGPSYEERRAQAASYWKSIQSERQDITGEYHSRLAALSAGGGRTATRTGAESDLAKIYRQDYEQKLGKLKESTRYQELEKFKQSRKVAEGRELRREQRNLEYLGPEDFAKRSRELKVKRAEFEKTFEGEQWYEKEFG